MPHPRVRMLQALLSLLPLGCATTPASAPPVAANAERRDCDPVRDHAAIMRMVGTFAVNFAFDETEALAPDYKPREPYHTDAIEVVTALEDTPQRVMLQHVLLIQKHSGAYEPQKHWRQDWTFQDRELWEYRGKRVWERRALSEAEVRCTWSQAVFEVDDAPRYESFAPFVYSGDEASWTSPTTWRPLPRREYTQRSDYDVLLAVNRHSMNAQGWMHDQDNVKLVLDGDKRLVRERGHNVYKRIELPEAAVARAWLEQTAPFWTTVRAEWNTLLQHDSRLHFAQQHDGKPLHEQLLPRDGESPEEQRARVHATVALYIGTPGA